MYNGIFAVDKPVGMTSHDVVARVRRLINLKKVGHTGTLDPEVTGVLPIVVGSATQLTEIMQERDKGYRATVTLGFSTDTEDQTGEVVETSNINQVDISKIDEVIESFLGDYDQQVPAYSSVRINGKKLYEYARKNIEVERPIRTVEIKEISRVGDIVEDENTISFDIDVICSKGTYVRTLAVDIGRKLGVHAHMSKLRRTLSCGIFIEETTPLVDLTPDDLIPIINILDDIKKVELVHENDIFRIATGQKLTDIDMIKIIGSDLDRVLFTYEEKPVGIYRKHPTKPGWYKPFKMFLTREDLMK
ncbi:tRNA pseudouridine(55) synthase TruB [Phocicoccus pinnipedialis]|uniref:tRNA pseudouridine synthase B n=1 Tax=Phocicoccus pinnipedialis TaxID=110845 RepID=A0A6V7RHM8_9BACL|nr:tRNA pseudouridine(55) synthase TruB [Jeotgalicoccus pinnipedialis]MBP1939125.1 tRNA pseudouridine55 synthase [Jeotgalicoccus pinnipedialis]CAD2076696.1 tRNA pseudouridine synthase B [Jeotgalicoccus pinnipedialis]